MEDLGTECDPRRTTAFASEHEEGLGLKRLVRWDVGLLTVVGDLNGVVAEILSVLEEDGREVRWTWSLSG